VGWVELRLILMEVVGAENQVVGLRWRDTNLLVGGTLWWIRTVDDMDGFLEVFRFECEILSAG
jgi:hypothetical protein